MANSYDRENKREYPNDMEVEEGETSKMPKKHKTKESDKLTQSAWVKGKNKMVKFKGPSFRFKNTF